MATILAGIQYDFTLNTKDFRQNIRTLSASIKDASKRFRQAQRELRLDPRSTIAQATATEALKNKVTAFAAATTAAKGKLSQLQAEQAKSKKTTIEASNRLARQANVVKDWESKLKVARIELKKFGVAQSLVGNKAFLRIGEKITSTLLPALLQLGLSSGFAARSAISLEDALGKVATIAQKTYDYDNLRNKAYQLSNAFGVEATDVLQGWYFLLSSGIKPTKDLAKETELMTHVARFARVGFAGMEESVRLVLSIIKTYGKELADVKDVTDQLITAQNTGIFTGQELADFFQKVTFNAAQFGVSLEEALAALVTITQRGAKTASATTYLNRVFIDLAKSGSKMSQVLKEQTGKSFQELLREGKSLAYILGIVHEEVGRNTQEWIDAASSIRSAQGAVGIFGKDGKLYVENLKKMREQTEGQTDAARESQAVLTKYSESINVLKNAFSSFGEGALAVFYEQLKNTLKAFADPKNRKHIVQLGRVLAEVGLTLARIFIGVTVFNGIQKMIIGVKSLTTTFQAMGIASSKSLGWIGLVITAFVGLYNKSEAFRNLIDSLGEVVTKVLMFIVNLFDKIFTGLGQFIDRLFGLNPKTPEEEAEERAIKRAQITASSVASTNALGTLGGTGIINPQTQQAFDPGLTSTLGGTGIVNINISADAEITDAKVDEISDRFGELTWGPSR